VSFLTLSEASRLLRTRAVSPVELTRSCLDQIYRHNGAVSAFITVTEETAVAEAREIEAEIGRHGQKTPLHGFPIALKDIFWTRKVRTTAQSAHLINHVPSEDAAIWARLREAGAILVGKTTTHEFAFAGPSFDLPWPNARNPWNPQYFAAGSSSGNAVAIACGMAFGAVGSDTGGSIRSPAALCGVVGLKPTYGLVSRYGAFATAQSLDHIGPMAYSSRLQDMINATPRRRRASYPPMLRPSGGRSMAFDLVFLAAISKPRCG
jgi:aspartyl-tRNA(Asn)/glutamyl-tRNA(Gln) amidotransferase subunit A